MSKIIFEDRTKGEENKEETDIFSEEKIEEYVKALAGTLSLTAVNTGYYYYLKPSEVILGLLTSMEDLIAIYSKELDLFSEEELEKLKEKAKEYSAEYMNDMKTTGKMEQIKNMFEKLKGKANE